MDSGWVFKGTALDVLTVFKLHHDFYVLAHPSRYFASHSLHAPTGLCRAPLGNREPPQTLFTHLPPGLCAMFFFWQRWSAPRGLPPDQSDHRGRNRNLQSGKSGRALSSLFRPSLPLHKGKERRVHEPVPAYTPFSSGRSRNTRAAQRSTCTA